MVAWHKKQEAGAGNRRYAFFAEFPPIVRDVRVRQAMVHGRITGFFLAILTGLSILHTPATAAQANVGIEQNFAASLTAMPTEALAVSGAFYVPVYSSVSMSQGRLRADFSVTLSVHNASETRPLVVKRIAYFDTSGKMVESYLKAPIALKPFSTVEVFIPVDRRARRHRGQFRGRLGRHGRDRRAGRGSADGRRASAPPIMPSSARDGRSRSSERTKHSVFERSGYRFV